jgi:hypothetical protein
MTKFKYTLAALLFSGCLILGACDTGEPNSYNDLPGRKFWAQNLTTNGFYRVNAELLAEGEKCLIWAETGSEITAEAAANIAGEYDSAIYPMMIDSFGMTDFSVKFAGDDEYVQFSDTLELASYLTNGEGKLIILLLDIKDGYTDGGDSYTAGYFNAGDFLPAGSSFFSNEAAMIYIDTYPGLPGSRDSFSTFAHELQHLINFTTSILLHRGADRDDPDSAFQMMDTWIDEGLATQAEYFYLKEHAPIRYEWYNQDLAGTIIRGNNFFIWDNHKNTPNSVLDDYATAYLFFQWMYLQADMNPELFRYIAVSGAGYENDTGDRPYPSDYEIVTEAAKAFIKGWNYDDWKSLLKTWLAANYINHPASIYGYKHGNNPRNPLRTVKAKDLGEIEGNKLELYPGEGVYSKKGSSFSYRSSGNISYEWLDLSGFTTEESAKALLTVNTNTSNSPLTETAYVTGVSADILAPEGISNARSLTSSSPLAVDARIGWDRENPFPGKGLWQGPLKIKPKASPPN